MSDLASSIARYFDNVASAAERAELLASLQADPQAFAHFRDDLRMHLELTSMLQPDDSAAIAAVIADLRPAVPTGATSRLVRALRPQVHKRGVVRRRKQFQWLAVAAAACLAVGVMLTWPTSQAGTVNTLTGSVSVLRDGEPLTVVSGTPLRRGDILTIGAQGQVAWHDADGAELTLAAGSARLAATRGGAVMLVTGVMHAEVQPRAAGSPPYCITTPSGDAQVLGTRFTLRVDEVGTQLEVERGRVRLTRGGTDQAIEVDAGEGAAVTPSGLEPLRLLTPSKPTPPTRVAEPVFQLIQHSSIRPSVLAWGEVVAESADPDGWCLQAVNYGNNLEVYLQSSAGTGLFTVPEDGWLTFRYRIDGAGEPLCIYSRNQTTAQSVNITIRPTTFGSWATVRVPWSSFQIDGTSEPGVRPGDTLQNLVMIADPPTPGRTMHIDDIVCGSSHAHSPAVTP